MARTLQHNRSSTALDARPGTLQDRNGKTPGSMQGITKGCNPEKRFTPVDVEYSVLRALTPALLARASTCYGTDREISASFEQEKSATEVGQPTPVG